MGWAPRPAPPPRPALLARLGRAVEPAQEGDRPRGAAAGGGDDVVLRAQAREREARAPAAIMAPPPPRGGPRPPRPRTPPTKKKSPAASSAKNRGYGADRSIALVTRCRVSSRGAVSLFSRSSNSTLALRLATAGRPSYHARSRARWLGMVSPLTKMVRSSTAASRLAFLSEAKPIFSRNVREPLRVQTES